MLTEHKSNYNTMDGKNSRAQMGRLTEIQYKRAQVVITERRSALIIITNPPIGVRTKRR